MAFRVLVVDDEPDLEELVRQKFRRKIRDGEFDFVFARNGEEALQKLLQDTTIDVVMSDINMPVMDGLTLLARLSEVNRIMRAVMVSAYGDMPNIRIAMNRGAFDFLTKPIDFHDFEATINKAGRDLEQIKEGLQAREQLTAIRHELGVATRIQQSILPNVFPAFPSRKDFEIYAQMIPAREVGGDFYDFFLIDKDRLGFVIGDVSGKGVPAAIFMAVSRTLLRATALQGISAGECLQYVNGVLNKQTEAGMFVTVFYGILHCRSGELEFCLGGHNPPYLLTAAGDVQPLTSPSSPLVGILEKVEFETGRITLRPGDAIVLYTDGVTEARDANEVDFGEARLQDLLARSTAAPVEGIISEIIGDVRAYTAGAPQSDDITGLALRFFGQ